MADADIGIVIVGCNDGVKLRRCIESAQPSLHRVVYVDCGSSDTSLATARKLGCDVVSSPETGNFTRVEALNTGFDRLLSLVPDTHYVQFIDGSAELIPGWLNQAALFLERHDEVAVVYGQRLERFPERSVFNRLIDVEWRSEPGEVDACHSDFLCRAEVFEALDGFDMSLKADVIVEFCYRVRQRNRRVWCFERQMSLHETDIIRFRDWWRAKVALGYGQRQCHAKHRGGPEKIWLPQLREDLFWGALQPLIIILSTIFVSPWCALFILAYIANGIQLYREYRQSPVGDDLAGLLMLARMVQHFASLVGQIKYWHRRFVGPRFKKKPEAVAMKQAS